ncbi:hypothetical protein BH24PSE2_BH24PSE2_05190 [soil metagenome]
MRRRRVLLMLCGALAGAAGMRLDRRVLTAGLEPPMPIAGLAELFRDRRAAVAVGKAYLATLEGPDPYGLLLAGAGLTAGSPLHPRAFDSLRKRQFLDGDTVLVKGWIMARAELCACGLLAWFSDARSGG